MVAQPEAHDVVLTAPWYAPAGRKVAIQRYFDPGFVAQFQADAANATANDTALFAWESEDRIKSGQGAPQLKLRRPVHRTFHIVAWEAHCAIPAAPWASPAIAPAKIASAGFVLRDVSGAAPAGFEILKGKPQGWALVDPKADPDAVRQVKALSLVPRAATPSPGYTGEEVFPLHPLAVTGGATPHTLLYGYLPIGGGDYLPPAAPAPDTGEVTEDLPWPFGLQGMASPPQTYTADQQIIGGTIQPPLVALLRVLLGRYQLVDPAAWSQAENMKLIAILGATGFYADPPTSLAGQALRDWAAANLVPGVTLGSVLLGWTTPAPAEGVPLATLVNPSAAASLLLAANEAFPKGTVPLPAAQALPAGAQNLLVLDSTASQLRDALRYRLAQATAESSSALPAAKLVAGPAGRYVVVPFLRTIRPDGCEKIFWGQQSDPFSVAAMFDPDASRPTLIEMPDLADARKGLAKGATFNLPPNLADLMNSLSTTAGIKNMWSGSGSAPSAGLGVGFICSFSLPAISICAMLMLSITLSLLNIFLGWMAWVKICLPIPVKK